MSLDPQREPTTATPVQASTAAVATTSSDDEKQQTQQQQSNITDSKEEGGPSAVPRAATPDHVKVEETHSDDDGDSDTDVVHNANGGYGGMRLRDLAGDMNTQFPGYKRERWWQLWRPKHAPEPAPKSLDDAPMLPHPHALSWSALTFTWVTPLMMLGYQRPLQATDLWAVDESRQAEYLSDKFTANLDKRQAAAKEWNASLPTVKPPLKRRMGWAARAMRHRHLPADFATYGPDKTYAERRETLEAEWRARSGKRHGSITWALNDTFPEFWLAGIFKVIGDTSGLMQPLLVKAIIRYSQRMYAAKNGEANKPNPGEGVGLAIGLFFLTICMSVCNHQFFYRSMMTGALTRAALISATYRRALKLTVSSRAQHLSRVTAHISNDISRIDTSAQWFHAIWTAPIQLSITLILLCLQLGASGLVGFVLFFALTPLQTMFMKQSINVRKGSMKWTDGRSRLLTELLGSMSIIKCFTFELPFLKRLAFMRGKEMHGVRKLLWIRSANQAMAFSIPVLASVLSFTVYSATHSSFDPAIIFTALAFFSLLRQPLMFLPRSLSSLADAQTAVERLQVFFEAEVLTEDENLIDPNLDVALRVEDATFQWIAVEEPDGSSTGKEGKDKGKKDKKDVKTKEPNPPPKDDAEVASTEEPFSIDNLNMEVPYGRLVAVVGRVGSGKSSLLQGLLGEMQRKGGSVEFGGKTAYCQQAAWIQNGTVRDNVVFGQKWDETRYWECITAASLVTDLYNLPDGDLTEIGEKGINLSGGQKQRINIARCLYFDAPLNFLDDPLSAVDSHVGNALFNDAILGLKAGGKTVILVTHALHFLPATDYIYTMETGRIVEQGTFNELMASGGAFSKLMDEFGGAKAAAEEKDIEDEENAIAEEDTAAGEEPDTEHTTKEKVAALTAQQMGRAAGTGKLEGRLMLSEERKTGAVGGKVYAAYLKAGQWPITLTSTIFFGALMQTANILSTVWLTWWEDDSYHKSTSFYQGIYAMLGVVQSLAIFGMGGVLSIMAYFASKNLFKDALRHLFFAPMSFFNTQPLGRLMGVLTKDTDQVDNVLPDAWRMMAITIFTLIGQATIIATYLHPFVAVLFVVGIGYWYFALFYRTSAREVKRLDSMLRSLLYAHFGESLSGLATIRAYGEKNRFIKENNYYVDLNGRGYYLTSANQRWLAIRLDFLGAILVFCVAIMATQGGAGLKASQVALCLTYLVQLTQLLGMMVRQTAEVENSMNAVERLTHFSDGSLPQEAAYEIPDTMPDARWPAAGHIAYNKVVMSYREGLPPVLKGISVEFEPSAKVGIVGRTGAGKTSMTVALFRLAELTSGTIFIDGVDISTLGLKELRQVISLIPQDPVLFSGTLRSNLDPFDSHDDASLHSAMECACLMDQVDTEGRKRFTLDMTIDDEGSNLSVGERSLVSLARALVKDSKIVILDEATASVDLETDALIQASIRRNFKGKTLLCIAHRLRTIIGWDKILVMDAGEVAEYDTPLNLYDRGEEGIFRTMCDRSQISREEIMKATEERE